MTDVYRFSEPQMVAFLLTFLRMSAFVVVWPIFGVESVPTQLKVLLALVLSVLIFPVIASSGLPASPSAYELVILATKEVFVGLFFGFLARGFFFILRIAGELISVSIGLSGAQLYNPAMGGMVTPTDTFLYTLGGLFFLMIQGHHILLVGIQDTFRLIPLARMTVEVQSMVQIAAVIQDAVVAGFSMAAPVVVAIFVANVAMGILGRTVPQINVLITSLAANAMLGLFVLIVSMPNTLSQMESVLQDSLSQMFRLIKGL